MNQIKRFFNRNGLNRYGLLKYRKELQPDQGLRLQPPSTKFKATVRDSLYLLSM